VATPFPGSIILYEKDQGYPDFNPARAQEFMKAVARKLERTILDVFQRWNKIRK
jgi:hypothetical protein